eukprot:364326-Chlamydomonas_euryale.AAC.7
MAGGPGRRPWPQRPSRARGPFAQTRVAPDGLRVDAAYADGSRFGDSTGRVLLVPPPHKEKPNGETSSDSSRHMAVGGGAQPPLRPRLPSRCAAAQASVPGRPRAATFSRPRRLPA